VGASEIAPFPIKVTRLRFPDLLHGGDITMLKGAELPSVDVVCGGSPGQDLSVAGKRAGLQGERSGLFMEQVRIVKEMRAHDARIKGTDDPVRLRPRYMVWENVPGAFSSADGEDFRTVLEETCRIVDSSDLYLDLRPGYGNLLGPYWDINSHLLGGYWTLNTGPSPKDAKGSSLSRILQDTVPDRYYLSKTACLGILRRAKKRGKELPPLLRRALEIQAGLPSSAEDRAANP
jgi:hypothetical protein